MKKVIILLVVFLYVSIVNTFSQDKNIDYKIITIDDSVTLKQVKILDEYLSTYLLKITDEQRSNKDLKEYIYVIQFSKQSCDSILMQVSLRPPIVLRTGNFVFFETGEKPFVIKDSFPNTIFETTENSKVIHYKERKIVKDNIMLSMYSRPEEFFTWHLMFKIRENNRDKYK